MEALIGAAQVVVSMGGYNTLCEIASQKKPSLIVPRTAPREEQLIRAQVLCSQGFCDYLQPSEFTPEMLRARVLDLLENGSAYRQKMTSFPFTALDFMRKRIQQHMRGTPQVTDRNQRLGMILKGYPRISESFISTEILLLESLGIPIEIYSLRQPREAFSHEHVKEIRAPATYLPEYVLPHWQTLVKSNRALGKLLGPHYTRCLAGAVQRAWERKKPATLRHFLQAGHLAATCLMHNSVTHLHAHFCHTPTSVALFASELTGLPFSFTAHAKDIYISEPEQLVRKIRKARFVVTCTEYNAQYLLSLAESAACATPLHVIYHGIDLNLFTFAPARMPGPPYQVLSIGRLVPKKGYDTLLKIPEAAGSGWS